MAIEIEDGLLEPVTRSTLERRTAMPPFWLVGLILVSVVVTFIPLLLGVMALFAQSTEPRIHLFQDMDNQPKVKAQSASVIFADGRGMRPPVAGTVARGQLQADDHYERGFTRSYDAASDSWKVEFFTGFPDNLTVDEQFVRRGQQQYLIFCATCHGPSGFGNGTVHQSAMNQPPNTSGRGGSWVPPTSFHTVSVRSRSDGYLYSVVNNGVRNMAGYGAQIPPRDRWAIVAYLRALQLSQNAPENLIPTEVLDELPVAGAIPEDAIDAVVKLPGSEADVSEPLAEAND